MIEGLPGWVELSGGIVGGSIALGVLWRIAKALWAFNQWLIQFAKDIQVFTKVMPDLISIAYEVKPNGGANLRGAIDRIEKKADLAAKGVEAVREMTEKQNVVLKNLSCVSCKRRINIPKDDPHKGLQE